MKISKLFHWLYAILMLLPVAMFIPTAFYYGFNEQAQAQTKTETIETENYFLTTEETNLTINDLQLNTLYKVSLFVNVNLNKPYFNGLGFEYLDIYSFQYLSFTSQSSNNRTLGDGEIEYDEHQYYIYAIGNTYEFELFSNSSRIEIVFALNEYTDLEGFTDTFGNNLFSGVNLEIPNGTNTITTNEYTMSITDSMSTAWTNTWSNPLFSWSANGFLIAPFNYITELFGMPNSSTFSLALNYWLTISIVYLVFDLVMYVPLLAHRWIDKGMVE